jgi:hypothetical protein
VGKGGSARQRRTYVWDRDIGCEIEDRPFVERENPKVVALVGNALVMGKVGGGALKIGIKSQWKEINEMTVHVARTSRSRWLRGLRLGFAGVLLLGLQVRIPHGVMSVSCDCCVLSGRDLCVGLITRPEESYRLWCV